MTRDEAIEKAKKALVASRGQDYPTDFGYAVSSVEDIVTVLEALGMPFDKPAAPAAQPTQQPPAA